MFMKKISIVIVLGIISLVGYSQQQPMYGQYMFNMLNVNPAYAGNRDVGNVNFMIRRQWLGIDGAPATGSISYDQRIKDKNYSVGGQVYYDNVFIQKRSGLQGFYSYSAGLGASTLSMGMSFGVMNYNANYGRTNPFQTGDPALQRVVNGFLPTAGFGALWSGEKWYIGLSTPNLFKSYKSEVNAKSVSMAGKEGHYYVTAGYIFSLSDQVVAKPSVMIKSVSGAPVQYDVNMNLWFGDRIGVGASYRTGDAIVGLAELQINPQLRIGYAFEQKIKVVNTSSHELMMRYEFGGLLGKKILSPRYY
ncbi:MAG: type IX secretion system membrane protein PorP/SprF [Chitinophagia bacterium]|jgi:type IX secretion system PorP/SprF family membrane protein|nr:type IX secretion system membrane protein PorP/SprF [Chitinophagia bacterium]